MAMSDTYKGMIIIMVWLLDVLCKGKTRRAYIKKYNQNEQEKTL
jgi:hypothetical protein